MLAFRVTAAVAAAATAEKMMPTARLVTIHHQAALTAQTVDAGPSTDENFPLSLSRWWGPSGGAGRRMRGFGDCRLALTSQFGAGQFDTSIRRRSIRPSEPAPEQARPDQHEKDDYDDGRGVVINLVRQHDVQTGGQDNTTMSLDLVSAYREATDGQRTLERVAGWPLLTCRSSAQPR